MTCIVPHTSSAVLCARFNSNSFNECSDKSIWGVLEQLDVEFVGEGAKRGCLRESGR